jgi:hypothetical protein
MLNKVFSLIWLLEIVDSTLNSRPFSRPLKQAVLKARRLPIFDHNREGAKFFN